MLQALTPLDGRYEDKTHVLRQYFSEQALIGARVEVEVRYFMALCDAPGIKELPGLKTSQKNALEKLIANFGTVQAKRVKEIEKKTNHDVKAVEYYLKEQFKKAGLRKHSEFVHFGLTSEDVNNLAYGILTNRALKETIFPQLQGVIKTLSGMARRWKNVSLLSLTHGQPATPTTVGKEFLVFVERLERHASQLKAFRMHGKFGGAVGTYSAHKAAYPKVNWEAFGQKFMKSLGVTPLNATTQINPHDDIAELSHLMARPNSILVDASRDIWSYISRGVFGQKVIKGEVGSSTMPHKVNPIDFENAEGNLGISSALFNHFAEKLPISRLQRDLSDSTVQRSIGSAFGYHTIAIASFARGLTKLELDRAVTKAELSEHPEVLAEAVQTVLRRQGVQGAYEELKKATRGHSVTEEDLIELMKRHKVPDITIQAIRSIIQ